MRIPIETITNQTGSYYVTNLPPGTYRIEAEKLGFKVVIKQILFSMCKTLGNQF